MVVGMKIGFDLDGVLYPWQEVVYANISQFTKRPIADYSTFWNTQIREFGDCFWNSIMEYSPFYTQREPEEGVPQILNNLSLNNEIYYITSRPKCVKTATILWLEKYNFPHLYNLHFSKEKHTIVRLEDIDVFVDDRHEYMDKLKNICRAFLMDAVYNREYADPRITRIYNIKDLLSYI
jgi:uncharacterized HAD superfamily protein